MRYWSYNKNALVEDGKVIFTKEEIIRYHMIREKPGFTLNNSLLK